MTADEETEKPRAAIDSRPPTHIRHQVLFAACTVAVITYVHRVGFATATNEFKGALGLGSEHVGYLMTAFQIAYAIFEIPGGRLGDRYGVRNLLTILVLGWSMMTGCVALVVLLPAVWAVRFGYLLVLRFLFGMFQAGGFPSLSRMMADWMPVQERASAQGFIWMSSRLGGALVPVLLGVLFHWFAGWQTPVWIVACVGLLWCILFWPWFRNRPEEMKGVNASERELIAGGRIPGDLPSDRGKHLPWKVLLGSRNVWGLCLMYGFMAFSGAFFITMLQDYLRYHRHLTEDQTRWLASLPLACGMVACLAGGVFSDWLIRRGGSRKWSRRLNGAIGLSLAGLAMLCTLWVQDVTLLAVLLCVTFFCNDLNMGPAWAACADIGERSAGTVGGAMNMFGNAFAAVMTSLAGRLLDRQEPFRLAGHELLGKELLFVLFACSYGLAVLSWFLVDVTKPLMSKEP